MKERRPEIVTWLLPINFFRAILQPICECHVAVRQVNRILSSCFGSNGVLLGQDQAHDLAQPNVLEEKLDVYIIRRIFCRLIQFIFDEIVLGDHLNIGIIGVDMHRATKGDSH